MGLQVRRLHLTNASCEDRGTKIRTRAHILTEIEILKVKRIGRQVAHADIYILISAHILCLPKIMSIFPRRFE
jgi:hypothetical protein